MVVDDSTLHKPISSCTLQPCRVGVERSKVEVQFRDLHVQAEVLIGDSGLPTVGNSFKGLLEVKHNMTATNLMLLCP